MVQTTSPDGFPYYELGDPPDLPDATQGLAEAVQSKTSTVDATIAALPKGIVGEASPTNAATTGTTEAFRGTITATLSVGRKYLLQYRGQLQGNTAGALVTLRLRYKAGSSVDSSGTLIQAMGQHVQVADKNAAVALGKSFTVASNGQFTVGVSLSVGSGTAKLDYAVGLVEPYLLLTDIGAS